MVVGHLSQLAEVVDHEVQNQDGAAPFNKVFPNKKRFSAHGKESWYVNIVSLDLTS